MDHLGARAFALANQALVGAALLRGPLLMGAFLCAVAGLDRLGELDLAIRVD